MDWRDGYDYICNVGHVTLTSSIILEALWIRYYGYKCFSLKFWKKFFLIFLYSFWKDLSKGYLVVSKFLLEVTKFKENVLICIITVIKMRDLLLTFLQVITILMA